MTRQSFSQLQQGLFASLALMVTLIGGQQLQHWKQSEQPAPQFERPVTTQTHFRSVGSAADVTSPQLMTVDHGSALDDLPYQERWVF